MPAMDIAANSLTEAVAPPRTIVLVIVERKRRDGRYTAHCNGQLVVANVKEPFLDGTRVLLGQGFDPGARYVTRRSANGPNALVPTLGQAAKLTVEEGSQVDPVFRPWKPWVPGAKVPEIEPEAALRARLAVEGCQSHPKNASLGLPTAFLGLPGPSWGLPGHAAGSGPRDYQQSGRRARAATVRQLTA
jgi:hypothetical protein